MLQIYEGSPRRILTEDGYEYRPTFWVRYVTSEGKSLIYGESFYDRQAADEFIQSFDWCEFNEADWIE